MKPKKQLLLLCLICGFAFSETQAQNFYINFTASGLTTTLDSVYVENLTQGTSLTLQSGDTLHLFGTAGVNYYNDNVTELKVYPNPFTETSKLEFYSEALTIATIDVYDVVGKHIIQLKQLIQKGTNIFEVSGFATGHYKLSISTDTWQKSTGFVSINTKYINPDIQLKSALLNNMPEKSTSKGLKNTISMFYITGDQMRFIGYSGLMSEIVNDVPTSNKTIDFVFASFNCGNTVTFIYNGSSVTYGTVLSSGKCWLDRNLGAAQVATSSTDANAYGDLYQWGRAADGHQIRTSGQTSTLSNSDTPGHGDFITSVSSPHDWRSPQSPNMWQGVNGTNNPCPSGWRVPTETEWNAERLSWSTSDEAGAFASPLKLSMAGCRESSDGSLIYAGSLGHYWSSTVSSTKSCDMYFDNLFASIGNYYRALGFSVRCLKDN